MIRTWRLQTLTGAAQPMFGDVTTAAIAASDGSNIVLVHVGDTTLYQQGDRIVVGAGTGTSNILMVDVLTSSTVLQCRSEGNAPVSAYATNATIQLAINASDIRLYVMAGSLNPVYLGTDSTVTSTGGGNTFFQATTNTPFLYTDTVTGNNPTNTAEVWMAAPVSTQAIAFAIVS